MATELDLTKVTAAIVATAPAFLAARYGMSEAEVVQAIMDDVPGARARLAELIAAVLSVREG